MASHLPGRCIIHRATTNCLVRPRSALQVRQSRRGRRGSRAGSCSTRPRSGLRSPPHQFQPDQRGRPGAPPRIRINQGPRWSILWSVATMEFPTKRRLLARSRCGRTSCSWYRPVDVYGGRELAIRLDVCLHPVAGAERRCSVCVPIEEDRLGRIGFGARDGLHGLTAMQPDD